MCQAELWRRGCNTRMCLNSLIREVILKALQKRAMTSASASSKGDGAPWIYLYERMAILTLLI